MADEDLHIETALLHGAYATEEITGATVPPIFQSASFACKSAEEPESVFAGRSTGTFTPGSTILLWASSSTA